MKDRDQILRERKQAVLRQKSPTPQGAPFNTHKRDETGQEVPSNEEPVHDDLEDEEEIMSEANFSEPMTTLEAGELPPPMADDDLDDDLAPPVFPELDPNFERQELARRAELQLSANLMMSAEYNLRGMAMVDHADMMMDNLMQHDFTREEAIRLLAAWGQGSLF